MRKRQEDEQGAAAVEFALLVLPFSLLLFGIIQFGWFFWTAEGTNSAAREVARRVVVGDCWGSIDQVTVAQGHAPNVTSVTVTDPSGLNVGDEVVVAVTSDSDIIGFIPGIPTSVERTYRARMEVNEDSGECEG
jgi:Flp pilus assembly protein TadG